jgi:F-type H+-transporting ATPase subunit b
LKHQRSSLFVRLHFLVLLVVAVAGVAPVRSFAQEPGATLPETSAPAAKDQSGPNLQAAPGQVKKEEAEEDNVYRHTKLVGSISDAVFHDDPNATAPEKVELRERHIERTARIFEWINAAIIILAIIIPLGRYLPKLFRQRSLTLSNNLETARKTTADANARLSAVEAQLSRLDDEIAKIRAQVEQESKQDEQRIKATIDEERVRIIAAAEQEISVAAAHARRGLRHFAADLAIEQAVQQLTLTPDADRLLIAEFVRDAADGAVTGGHK